MALFAGNKLYLREVKDPDDGQIYHVKLRKMDEGYREQRSDDLMHTRDDTQKKHKKLPGARNRKRREQITEYNLGTVRLSDLEYSIREWDFVDEDGNPMPKTIQSIKKLDAGIADQIWNHIEALNPTVFNVEEDEEEEEEEYEDEEEEAASINGNGAVTAEPFSFGHDEGPKESVEQS